jgi:hypothetical protein
LQHCCQQQAYKQKLVLVVPLRRQSTAVQASHQCLAHLQWLDGQHQLRLSPRALLLLQLCQRLHQLTHLLLLAAVAQGCCCMLQMVSQ